MHKILSLTVVFALLAVSGVHAQSSKLANEEEIKMLKRDLLNGRIKIDHTRLKKIKEVYGEAEKITETENKLIHEYGSLKLDFDKRKYLRDWEYDYSEETAYSDDIDNLRFDLEDQQLIGDFVTLDRIFKDYGDPTKAMPKKGDGEHSVYYWGELKLTFENFIVIKSWKGSGLDEVVGSDRKIMTGSEFQTNPGSQLSSGVY